MTQLTIPSRNRNQTRWRTVLENLKILGVDIPEGTPYPYQGRPDDLPDMDNSSVILTVAEILNYLMLDPLANTHIHGYEHNRGDLHFNSETYKNCFINGYDRNQTGHVGIAIKNGLITLTGWHSRGRAFLQRYVDGNMTEHDLTSKVPVNWLEDYLTAYNAEGSQGLSHTSRMQTSNPDYAFGYCREQLYCLLNKDVQLKLKKFSNPINAIFLAFHKENMKEKVNWRNWYSLYSKRGRISKADRELAGAIVVTEKQLEVFKHAIIFWYDLICELETYAKNISDVKKIIRSGGFFGYVMSDRIGSRGKLKDNHKRTARNFVNDIVTVVRKVNFLCRNDEFDVEDTVILFDKIANKRR